MSAGAPSRSGVLRSTSSLRKAPTDSSWLQVDNSMTSGTACSGGSSHKEGLTGWVHLQGRDGDQINAGLAVVAMVCSEGESGGRMFLGDVAAGNSCFGRAAQEICEKGEGPGVLNLPSPRFT